MPSDIGSDPGSGIIRPGTCMPQVVTCEAAGLYVRPRHSPLLSHPRTRDTANKTIKPEDFYCPVYVEPVHLTRNEQKTAKLIPVPKSVTYQFPAEYIFFYSYIY